MRGSYLAKVIESDIIREQRRKEAVLRKKFRQKCAKCKNKATDLCHITHDTEGNLKCVNYEVEQNT